MSSMATTIPPNDTIPGAVSFDDIIPPVSSRSLLVGRTGSGKSTLAMALLHHIAQPSIVILDPKGDFDFPGAAIIESPDELTAAEQKADVIIYRPDPETVGIDHWNRVLRWVYMRGNTVLYIDELFGLSENGVTYPPMLKGIYTRGRGKGITTLAATQRPKGIPVYARSEAEYFFVYDCGEMDDRKKLAEEMGRDVMLPLDIEFQFWFWNRNKRRTRPITLRLDL